MDQVLEALVYPAMCQWARMECQIKTALWLKGKSGAFAEPQPSLKAFLASATLTVGNLIQHNQTRHSNMTSTHTKLALKSTALEIAQVNQGAREAVYNKSMRQWRKEAFMGG